MFFLGSTSGHPVYEHWAQVGYISDGTATTEEILSDPIVRPYPREEAEKIKAYIYSFNIVKKSNLEDIRKSELPQGSLSESQKELIKKCKPGDVIYFEEVIALCPDCSGLKLPPFQIEIVSR